jgi:predicted dehydrogenase
MTTHARRMKVHGAGSIGNHLAHAARSLGWTVVVCDIDPVALERMRTELYPGRYGSWDDQIELCRSADAPRGGFDVIHIGTPPESHVPLALDALEESPGAILIEKPLSPPAMTGVDELVRKAEAAQALVFVGYDHVVGRGVERVTELVRSGTIGAVQAIDVDFREHWSGILKAHPWLKGPADTYLGFTARGGGASGEHSHALNLWQYFAQVAGAGAINDVSARLSWLRDGGIDCDRLCLLTLRTENGVIGRVAQDVITQPPRKQATLFGSEGTVTWTAGPGPNRDTVTLGRPGSDAEAFQIEKSRPDDFIRELTHIEAQLGDRRTAAASPLWYMRGVETMRILAAALKDQS